MENQPEKGGGPSGRPMSRPQQPNSTLWILLVLVAMAAAIYYFGSQGKTELEYGVFREQLKRNNIAEAEIRGNRLSGKLKQPVQPSVDASAEAKPAAPVEREDESKPFHRRPSLEFTVTVPPSAMLDPEFDRELLSKLGAKYSAGDPPDNSSYLMFIYLLVSLGLFGAIWFMMRRSRDQMLGGGMFSGFSKSPARRYEANDQRVTFDDVAGLEGVKNELQEIVEFLKNPDKFQRLGGRVPKGILLMGPPGTGKTLLGRAVAGEAGVPFFSINGSEFIQMFVGVGAGRVRDLFNTAKAAAPAILFIDEIDAVGRHRGTGLGGGNDEREQTLNQILSEMDGFTQSETVIVMAATNRPDVLDPALLRPGRFDRHITVDRPSLKGRLAIFKVHTKCVVLADDVDLERLAAGSVGLTGADIRNLVNEAALWATRQGKDRVEMADFEYARDKVLIGSKREEVLAGKEKTMTAFHESGHVLVAWLVPSLHRVHKVSIIPRGRTLGATQLLPEEDRVNVSEGELHARLLTLLGGRTAEKIAFNELTAGAEDDLKRATEIARRMVAHWGMSERVGPAAFRLGEEHPFLGKEIAEPRQFSEHMAQLIDEEIVRILRDASAKAERLLTEHRPKLDTLAAALERDETLDERQIEELIGPPSYRPNGDAATAE